MTPLLIALPIAFSGLTADIKLPVKVEKPGFLFGFWDAGRCYVSGQPNEEAFRQLAKDGVRTVINMRGTSEMNDRTDVPFDEAALLKELGIKYVHIPMGERSEYNPSAIEKFSKAIDAAEGKVHLHCTVGWRASYTWAAYLYRYQKYSLDDAIKHGSAMNFTPNRIAPLLGIEMTYTATPRKAGGTKLKDGPIAIVPPNDEEYLAWTLWQMGDVFNASQPSEENLRDLAKRGVKTVINIRGENEMKSVNYDEKAFVESLGMTYVHVPMLGVQGSTPDKLKLVADAITNSKGKTLLHCQSGTRTSSVWVAYLVKYKNMPLEEALKHGEAMRYSSLLNDLLDVDITYKVKQNPPAERCGGGL